MRSLTTLLLLSLLLVSAPSSLGCGGDELDFGKRCVTDADCLGGICYSPALGPLPNAYCTKVCRSAEDCPGDYDCASFPGTKTPSTCVKKVK